MRRGLKALPAALLLMAVATPAVAQDKPVTFHFSGGAYFPMSDSRDSFKDGWAFGAGLTYHFNESFGLQADYSYNRHSLKGEIFQVTRLNGNHALQTLDLSAAIFPQGSDNTGIYLLAGGGAYHRRVEITEFAGYAGGIICNPWWYVCYPGAVPVDRVLGARSSWDFGINVGVGVQFELGDEAKVFVEARYRYIRGDKFDVPEGTPQVEAGERRATGQYLPLTIGIRF